MAVRAWILFVSAMACMGCGEPDAPPPAPLEPAAPAEAPSVADAASEDAAVAAQELAAAGAFPHDASDVPADPLVRYGRMDNGLRYAVMANDTPTDTAALRVRIDMGSLNEAEDERGLAHFIEHMAFNGTTNIPEDELVKMLERFGLAFGADTNAYTAFHETVYQLDLPSTDEETVDAALFILSEMVSEALFDPEAVDRERGVVLSEERVRDTFGLRYLRARNRFLFPDSLISERLPIGLLEVIETAPAQRMKALYDAYYTPERAFVAAVGDFDVDAMETKLREAFSGWTPPSDPGLDPDLGVITARPTQAGFFTDPDMYTIAGVYLVSPWTPRPDTLDTRRTALLEAIGEGVLSRRLQRLSRDPDARFLQATVSSEPVFGTKTADMAALEVVSRPEDWRAALALAEQELRRAVEHGFTAAEVNEQLANIRTSLENAADQADTRETPALANGVTQAFGAGDVFSHPDANLAQFEAVAPDVTPQAVLDAFRARWTGPNPLVFLANNAPVPDAEQAIMDVFTESQAIAVSPPTDLSGGDFAYTDFGAPGVAAEQGVFEPLAITRARFDNGVRVNVKQTDFEDDVVRVSVRVGGGLLETPKDLPGLPALFNNAFALGGLEAHSADDLQSVLAGRTWDVNSAVADDAFVFTAATTPEDLLLQLQIFAAYLTAPGFRPEGEAQYRQLFDIVYDTLDAQPASVRRRDMPRLLRSGDPRFGLPAKDALLARSYEDLQTVLERPFTAGAIEIGVVGDVSPEAALEAVGATFGALPARSADPEPFAQARLVAFPEDRAPITLTHAGEADQAEANVYWPTTDDSDVMLARRLVLLERVMDLKLIARIREQEGATYSPRAGGLTSRVNPGFGYFFVSLALTPEDVGPYFAIIDEIAAEMAAGAITDDELERARRPLLEQLEESLEDNGYWLGLASRAQTQPRYLERSLSRAEDYAAITAEDLAETAAAYLTPDQALRVAIVHETLATRDYFAAVEESGRATRDAAGADGDE